MTPHRRTTIAIDFDRTFTSDVDFWRLFIQQAVQRGHRVLCVTGRAATPYSRAQLSGIFGEFTFSLLTCCIFCDHAPKRQTALAAGYDVDIWIDDLPEGVGAADTETFRTLEKTRPVCETLDIFDNDAVHPFTIWTPDYDAYFVGRGRCCVCGGVSARENGHAVGGFAGPS
jgi:hypothetical protein